jgi:hydrogenase maturation factor HypF (carbamoyltransferase family)
MYLHIGNNKVVRETDIVGIFDLDSSTVSVNTRSFLKNAQNEKRVITLGYELPKSFIILKNNEVYLSPFNTSSIIKN